ncbi:GYDIA family GHMP kinase [Gramella sp. GC03-9]|uniref:GYDIA family GHMP kinase n=1 Tax=Christiangramia oceanisediminis TaxID=2920386 RepID=A0A9X2I4E9_9FLAO|nr:GYDIA family GHMP kinase [Gramella oceanisediminis]MCP9199660.1 GYDIA family GHMP kinase [Gramella oceanisediminis]
MQHFNSNGKILLTGEYAVLDGAKALALPTRMGQSLQVSEIDEKDQIEWKSFDPENKIWFNAKFRTENGHFNPVLSEEDQKDPEAKTIADQLQKILQSAFRANPGKFENSYSLSTRLEFDRKWGLGSSSTLINNISNWLEIDPYSLLKESFGGSGYDIAAAQSNNPVTFQITKNGPVSFAADFNPDFKDRLFFVYLNRKQNSREAIAHYRNQNPEHLQKLIEKISGLTESIISCDSLQEFEMLVQAHETLISKAIELPKVKQQLFPDYPGCIKSLGGWGGDFILATGSSENQEYFRNKGYDTIFDYSDLIL